MDGLEATRKIHKALPNTEILIFTQYELMQAAQAAEDAGARGCISKSEAAHRLVPALCTVSRHQPYFPSLQGIR
jgi:DNA-binding NarL/FixJ family response regulator